MAKKRASAKPDPLERLAAVTVGSIVVAVLVWVLIIKPFAAWVAENPVAGFFAVLLIAGALVASGYMAYRTWLAPKIQSNGTMAQHPRRLAANDSSRATLSERTGPSGSTVHATLTQKGAGGRSETILQSRLAPVLQELQEFQPSRRHRLEIGYQNELIGYLKGRFKNHGIFVEQVRGHGRPDIVVGDIAIEVKGPTSHNDLDTLPAKCHAYLDGYEHLVVVLFDLRASEDKYTRIKSFCEQTFGNRITIVRR